MKKRFLKFCSVLLCIVNLFSVVPVWGVEYEFSGGRGRDNAVYIKPSTKNISLPSFWVEKSNKLKIYGGYRKIPNIHLNDFIFKKCCELGLGVKAHQDLKLDINRLPKNKGEDWKNTLQSELNEKIAEKVGFIECKLESNDGYVRITAGNDVFKFKNTLQIQSEIIYLCKENLDTIKKLIGDSSSKAIDISDVIFDNLENLNNEEISNAIDKFYEKIKKITGSMGKDYKVKNEQGANKKIKYKRDNKIQKYMSVFLANVVEEIKIYPKFYDRKSKEILQEFKEDTIPCSDRVDICTPFGKVYMIKTKNERGKTECVVSCVKTNGDYNSLACALNNCTKTELVKIYEYLSMRYDSRVNSIGKFNEEVKAQFGNIAEIEPTNERQASFAAFCGVLIVAEPWRFKEGGGLSRASIRRIYKFIIDGVDNPFTVIFSNASEFLKKKENIQKYLPKLGMYLNESVKIEELLKCLCVNFSSKEGLAVFSHNSTNNEWRKFERAKYISGKQQQINQLSDGVTSFESEESVYDNKFRMHFFDEDVSDDEDVEKTVIEETPDPTEEVSGSEE